MDVHETDPQPAQGTLEATQQTPQSSGAEKAVTGQNPNGNSTPTPAALLPAGVAAKIGQTVRGLIQRPFEFGYIVSVDLGDGEHVQGVLYSRIDPAKTLSGSRAPGVSGLPASWHAPPADSQPAAKRRKRRRRPSAAELLPGEHPVPRAPCSAYNFFFKEWRKKLKEAQPQLSDRQGTAQVGERWNALPPEEKQKYKDMAVADKVRYEKEYGDRLLWRAIASSGGEQATVGPLDAQVASTPGYASPTPQGEVVVPTGAAPILSAIEPPSLGGTGGAVSAGVIPSAAALASAFLRGGPYENVFPPAAPSPVSAVLPPPSLLPVEPPGGGPGGGPAVVPLPDAASSGAGPSVESAVPVNSSGANPPAADVHATWSNSFFGSSTLPGSLPKVSSAEIAPPLVAAPGGPEQERSLHEQQHPGSEAAAQPAASVIVSVEGDGLVPPGVTPVTAPLETISTVIPASGTDLASKAARATEFAAAALVKQEAGP
eukprot:TRINITY_DN6300_c1_g1_i1.p1 TRINITY_DN6300_c1_g1~~TRINITY_DN6300_c1_g1_i1.p1  ORF type:complete len:486 (-),score=106.96 TRINITY_DN6300_c1_g1_i1:1544-3001(-)